MLNKRPIRTFAWAVAFLVAAWLGVGLWAAHRRAALRGPVAEDGRADADAVLDLAAHEHAGGAVTAGKLEALVAGRRMLGAMVLGEDGTVLARAGALDTPVVEAAIETVAAKPAARIVDQRILYRADGAGLIAVVVEDLTGLDAAWRRIRRTALVAALVAVLLSPLVGLMLARTRRRAAG